MEREPIILVAKPGVLGPRDARKLERRGIIIVEANDLEAVKFFRAGYEVSGMEMLSAALSVLGKAEDYENTNKLRQRLVAKLADIAMANTKSRQSHPQPASGEEA